MYNSSEEDLFPGHVKPFDPLKAQVRRAEIYKKAFDNVVKAINARFKHTIELVPEWWIEQAKEQVDNAAQS